MDYIDGIGDLAKPIAEGGREAVGGGPAGADADYQREEDQSGGRVVDSIPDRGLRAADIGDSHNAGQHSRAEPEGASDLAGA